MTGDEDEDEDAYASRTLSRSSAGSSGIGVAGDDDVEASEVLLDVRLSCEPASPAYPAILLEPRPIFSRIDMLEERRRVEFLPPPCRGGSGNNEFDDNSVVESVTTRVGARPTTL